MAAMYSATTPINADTVQIYPSDFESDRELAIKDVINRKYANKVLPQVGLCVALFDIEASSEGIILYGDGCIYHKVIFRMVIFKPFVDEVLVGKVARSTKDGIKVSLGFFDDCFIPKYRLPTNCSFDMNRSEFFWAANAPENADREDIEATPEEDRFYIISGEMARFRIISEQFHDVNPKSAPKANHAATANVPGQAPISHPVNVSSGPSPYRLECSIQEAGLGLLDWWRDNSAEDDPDVASVIDNEGVAVES